MGASPDAARHLHGLEEIEFCQAGGAHPAGGILHLLSLLEPLQLLCAAPQDFILAPFHAAGELFVLQGIPQGEALWAEPFWGALVPGLHLHFRGPGPGVLASLHAAGHLLVFFSLSLFAAGLAQATGGSVEAPHMGLQLLEAGPGPGVLAPGAGARHLLVLRRSVELVAGVAHLPALVPASLGLSEEGAFLGDRHHILASPHTAGLLCSRLLEKIAQTA